VALETWIVIADGARARLYSHRFHREPQWQPALDHDLVGTRLTNQGLESDRPGRTSMSSSHGSSKQGLIHGLGKSDEGAHRQAQIELARAVAHELETARQHGIRRFVFVAPPRALGDLREACTDDVRALVAHELDKDLTKMPLHELQKHLHDVLV